MTADALAEILATATVPAERGAIALRLAGASKRASGLAFDEREAVMKAVDWAPLAREASNTLARRFPEDHPAADLFPRREEAAGGGALFDLPIESLIGLIGGLKLKGEQIADAIRWVEFGDEDAFDRLEGLPRSGKCPQLDADPVIEERVVRLVWGSRTPVTEESAGYRLRGSRAADFAYHAFARVIARDLGLERRTPFGQPNRQFSDQGPLLAVAREIDDELFTSMLEAAFGPLKGQPAAYRLDLLAAPRWDSIADRVDSKTLVIDRGAAGVRVQGSVALKKTASLAGRFSLNEGAPTGTAEVDPAGAKAALAQWQLRSAFLAQVGAHHPELVKQKSLVTGGPDVVAALVPVCDAKLLTRTLSTLLKSRRSRENAESAQLIIDGLDTIPPKVVEQAAAGGFPSVVAHLLARVKLSAKQREKARGAAEDTLHLRTATLLRD